jgi:hypothetical protein
MLFLCGLIDCKQQQWNENGYLEVDPKQGPTGQQDKTDDVETEQ